MDLDAFLAVLTQCRDLGWFLNEANQLRSKCGCPVVTVAHRILGECFHTDAAGLAGVRLELEQPLLWAIVDAADNDDAEEREKGLRAKLLAAVGLPA